MAKYCPFKNDPMISDYHRKCDKEKCEWHTGDGCVVSDIGWKIMELTELLKEKRGDRK